MFSALISFFTTHWTEVAGVLAALVLFFDRLAKLTPTNADNVWVERLQRAFAFLGVRVQDNVGDIDKAYRQAAEKQIEAIDSAARAGPSDVASRLRDGSA